MWLDIQRGWHRYHFGVEPTNTHFRSEGHFMIMQYCTTRVLSCRRTPRACIAMYKWHRRGAEAQRNLRFGARREMVQRGLVAIAYMQQWFVCYNCRVRWRKGTGGLVDWWIGGLVDWGIGMARVDVGPCVGTRLAAALAGPRWQVRSDARCYWKISDRSELAMARSIHTSRSLIFAL